MVEAFGGVATSLLAFVAVLSVVVFVHEFGHYQVARWCRVKVDSFSMGFGPELFAWTARDGVRWRIGALPLGGYVKFAGDKDASSLTGSVDGPEARAEGLFHAQSVGVRSAVTLAGPMANFIFAIAVFAVFFTAFGETFQRPVVVEVSAASAAERAGLRAGDEVVSVDGARIESVQDLQRLVITAGGQPLDLGVLRDGARVDLTATPDVVQRETPFGDMESQGALGISLGGGQETVTRKRYNPLEATGRAVEKTGEILSMQVKFIAALVRGAMSPGHLSGPLGIGQISGAVAEQSAEAAGPQASPAAVAGAVALGLVELAAVLSIAIGFINLMPIPILDGGHLVFYAAEALRGRPVPVAVQEFSYKAGLVAVLSLFVFATVQDLDRIGLFNALKGMGGAG